jgi:hypothetical protein
LISPSSLGAQAACDVTETPWIDDGGLLHENPDVLPEEPDRRMDHGQDLSLAVRVGHQAGSVGPQVRLVFFMGGELQRVMEGMGGTGAVRRADGKVLRIFWCRTKCKRIRHTESVHRIPRQVRGKAEVGEVGGQDATIWVTRPAPLRVRSGNSAGKTKQLDPSQPWRVTLANHCRLGYNDIEII